MNGLLEYWTYDVPWGPTPIWLQWLGKPKYRAHECDWKDGGKWVYAETMPSYPVPKQNNLQ